MFHRRNRIALAAAISVTVAVAMAGPASARASAAAAASPAASTPVPVDITGDITWTENDNENAAASNFADKYTGTFHIDLTNVTNGGQAAGGDSSTYSYTHSYSASSQYALIGGNCVTTTTGSSSGSGPLLYPNGGIYVNFNPSMTAFTIYIGLPATEEQTTTLTGPPDCFDTGELPTTTNLVNLNAGVGCVPGKGQFLRPNGSLNGTYPNATVNVGCSETYTNAIPPLSGSSSVTGTLTITPSCGSGAAASSGGLCITSPPDNSTVALTDGTYIEPQPTAANDVAPAPRFLIVDGTTSCPDVTVNGVTATVTGDTWEAKLPIGDLGPLTLTADGSGSAACGQATSAAAASGVTASGVTATSTVTLINLKITNPASDGDIEQVNAAPAMPDLAAQVQVQGYSGDTSAVTFGWTLDVTGEYINRQGWHGYDMPFTGTTTGTSGSWSPDFGTIVGGWGKLVVSASLPGVLGGTVTSDPRWINMTGQNPGKAAVLSYIADNAGTFADTVSHIMCVESDHTFNQFNPAVNAGELQTPGVPDSLDNPATFRPLFGAPPSGIGIAQLDPATFPFENWNWKLNVSAGIDEFDSDYATASTLAARTQATLDAQYEQLRTSLNAQRTHPLPDEPVAVPALSDTQILYDAIRLYNYSGGEYIFNLHYKQGPNLTIKEVGSKHWEKNTGGPVPNYVHLVLHCKI
jgi:hypothetical protein